MFTSVDSNRQKLEHPIKENVQLSKALDNSIIQDSKSGLAAQLDHLLSKNDEYTKLQLLVPVCLFIFASKLGSLDIFPAMIGFFIYKPSLILYFSRS